METINTALPGMVLRTDALNMELLRLLMTRYTVVVENKNNEVIIELYPK